MAFAGGYLGPVTAVLVVGHGHGFSIDMLFISVLMSPGKGRKGLINRQELNRGVYIRLSIEILLVSDELARSCVQSAAFLKPDFSTLRATSRKPAALSTENVHELFLGQVLHLPT